MLCNKNTVDSKLWKLNFCGFNVLPKLGSNLSLEVLQKFSILVISFLTFPISGFVCVQQIMQTQVCHVLIKFILHFI